MRLVIGLVLICSTSGMAASSIAQATPSGQADDEGWYSLFDGKTLEGWKASENADTFKVVDGNIIIHGPRSHLFYVGPVCNANFTNFEWKCEVLLKPGSNSGMYFHTEYQQEGWPAKGYEVQLNNSHVDPKKTGGLYGVADVIDKSPARDNEWFSQEVTVEDRHIVVRVNGKVVTDYIEPLDAKRLPDNSSHALSHGTIALQGHDPGSEVHVREIKIRPIAVHSQQESE